MSICNFLWDVIIAFKLKKLVVRKNGLKPVTQPRRSMPEFETVMMDDEDFHLFVAPLQTA